MSKVLIVTAIVSSYFQAHICMTIEALHRKAFFCLHIRIQQSPFHVYT